MGFGSIGLSFKLVYRERLFFKVKLIIGGCYLKAKLLLNCVVTSPVLREGFDKKNQILMK